MTKVVVPPAIEPITASVAKLHTRVDSDIEDSLIETWIRSGRIVAEGFQNRAYIEQTLEMTLDRFPQSPFELAMPPLVSVESIKYFDQENIEHTIDPNDYYVDNASEPGRVSLNYSKSWPAVNLRPINGVVIRYKAGYGQSVEDVPKNVQDALLVYVTYRYYVREAEGDNPPQQFYWLLGPDRMVPV